MFRQGLEPKYTQYPPSLANKELVPIWAHGLFAPSAEHSTSLKGFKACFIRSLHYSPLWETCQAYQLRHSKKFWILGRLLD